MIVHQAGSDGKWSWATTLNLGEDLSRALSTIRLADFIAMETGAKQNSMLAIIWAEMKSAFNGGKKADSILLAAQWFFNGSHGPDELLKYVQAMVVLEILLGDKRASDQMGLNELLRNRCAYLIGNSHEDRASVHELFGKIYDVRSQIVHRGKHRLTLEERQLSSQLRWLCRRVIQKEVDLLKADKKN